MSKSRPIALAFDLNTVFMSGSTLSRGLAKLRYKVARQLLTEEEKRRIKNRKCRAKWRRKRRLGLLPKKEL